MSDSQHETIQIGTLEEYINFCMRLRANRFWSFRGQRSEKWELGPHIFSGKDKKTFDAMDHHGQKSMYRNRLTENLDIFMRYLADSPGLAHLQEGKDKAGRYQWSWMFYAQHYGLKTQLLDWTSNPLVALYFAVENILSNNQEDCGAVWALNVANGDPNKRLIKHEDKAPDTIHEDWVLIKNPPPLTHIAPRIVRQSGKFTFHSDHEPISGRLKPGDNLIKIIIQDPGTGSNNADIIRMQLGIMNIHHAALFPESEHVSKYFDNQWRFIALTEHLKDTAKIGYRLDPERYSLIDQFFNENDYDHPEPKSS